MVQVAPDADSGYRARSAAIARVVPLDGHDPGIGPGADDVRQEQLPLRHAAVGDVLDDATCSSDFLDPGETDYSPSCINAIQSIDGYDEIRFAEGY